MPISIEQLVELSHLGCEFFAGQSGAGRQATWAHVCELEDPLPWLEGGELVMTTGMAIPRDAHAQASYVARLTAAGAAGLAISKDLLAPKLSQTLAAEANRRGFPIVLVSIEVPFVTIARLVILANQDAIQREMVRQLSVFDALRETRPGDSTALFRTLEHVSGYHLYLSTPSGGDLLPGVAGFPEESRPLLTRPKDAPASVPGGYVISVPIGGRVSGYLLGIRRHESEPGSLATLQHIATIAALQRTMVEREREVARREGGELLAELLSGGETTRLSSRMPSRLGNEPIVLILVQVQDVEGASSFIHRSLSDAGSDHLILAQQDVVLLAPAYAPIADVFQAIPGAHAGRSREFRLGESLAVAEGQARRALERAVDRGEALVDAASFVSELDWLPSDPALRSAMVDRVLGPILAQEGGSGDRLVETLRVWLESGQRTGSAANRLNVHPHTLAYRLRRVEKITGRDLSAPTTIVELWLAIEVLRHDRPASVVGRSGQ
jgi:PucR family transcriptional regulator, purine catabolism regulatory protein